MSHDSEHGLNIRPVSEATKPEALDRIEHFRRLGILNSEMGILRDFPGGPEEVVVSKAGTVKLAKLSPQDGYTAINNLREMDIEFSLDEELDIIQANPEGYDGPEPGEYLAAVEEARRSMTLDGLRKMRRDAAGKPGVREGLGSRKFREYMDGEVERLGRRYGWTTKLDDAEMCRNVHALAVILNSFSIGDPDMEGLRKVEEKLTAQQANHDAK